MVDLALHVIPLKHLSGEVSVFRGVYVLQDLEQSHHAQQRCRISHGLVVVYVTLFNQEYTITDILLTLSMVVITPISMHKQDYMMIIRGGGSISDEKL